MTGHGVKLGTKSLQIKPFMRRAIYRLDNNRFGFHWSGIISLWLQLHYEAHTVRGWIRVVEASNRDTFEFFISYSQYKYANTGNFVLAVPLKINLSYKMCVHEGQYSCTRWFLISLLPTSVGKLQWPVSRGIPFPPPLWTDKQSENITFPRTLYTGSDNANMNNFVCLWKTRLLQVCQSSPIPLPLPLK